jgi:CheY-like chemotaxis protein
MDGFEFIARVRNELLLTPEVLPAVAVTAFAREEDRRRALTSGFQGHLAKPFEATQIVAQIAEIARSNGANS